MALAKSCPGNADPADHGITQVYSIEGVNKFLAGVVPRIETDMESMKISDIDTVLDLGITTVDLTISDMACSEMSMGSTTLTTLADTQQFQAYLDHVDIEMTFSWAFQEQSFPFVSDHGTGTASATDIHGSVIMGPAFNTACGTLDFSMEEFALDFGDIQIHLSGGASALYNAVLNTLIGLFQDLFTEQLDQLLADAFVASVNSLTESEQPYINVEDNLRADFRFVEPGIFIDNNFVSVYFTGYGYPKSVGPTWQKRLDDGLVPGDMDGRVNDEDTQLEISRSVYESILDAGITTDILKGVVDPRQITDPMSLSLLTTSTLASVCPGLYEAYPEGEVYLELVPSAEAVPSMTVMASAAYLNITGTVSV
ncbi:hypothetical protein KIPB_004715, partial [Kipferlia bialata]|eukprot:g4715.t1